MEGQNGALDVLLRAIQNEIAGQRFYDEAARYCVDLWTKSLLDTLAREEEQHIHLLMGQHEALRTGTGWLGVRQAVARGAAADLSILTFPQEDAAVTLFPAGWSAAEAFERGTDDLSALTLAIELEKLAMALYQTEGDAAPDPAAREAYGFLVQEERRHYAQLTLQWERLAGTEWED